MNNYFPRPITLIILDGWGHRETKEANAIAAAYKPNWDRFCQTNLFSLISGSGRCVGLPEGQMGNSEVGHLNMGAGRIVYQDFTRIDAAIESGDFFSNPTLVNALTLAKKTQKAVHLMGLLSPGGVHSHERHFYALIELAAQMKIGPLYVHPFLDGRDTPPRSAMTSLLALEALTDQLQCGKIASLIGRYYAMDRDNRWERVQEAYDLLIEGKANYHAPTAAEGLDLAYSRGENDEFVKATSIHPKGCSPIRINSGDIVIFMNFRADRARELTQAFIDDDFQGFYKERKIELGMFASLTEYDSRFSVPIAFPPQPLNNILAAYLSHLGLKQLRIAETEKYAHVTFFFNGGIEQPFDGEDRSLIPSLKIPTYDLQPQMSAHDITECLIKKIRSQRYDFIVCNFANADMVGHTGNFDATVKAIEAIDVCLGQIINALQSVGGEALITADHGNAEMMFNNSTNQPHTAHTSDPVPLLYIGRNAVIINEKGKLSDIAPTILYLMGLPKPQEMTGETLLKFT